MAKRKRMYSKKRMKINYKRIGILLAAIIILIFFTSKIFKKDNYTSKIKEALNSDIYQITGSISTVSKVDATVYENDGITYTNQHEGIIKHIKFDKNASQNVDKAEISKTLLEELLKSVKADIVAELPAKDSGYYWLETDIFSKTKILFFNKQTEYNFDLYYDIENETIYVKEKYFDEFNKKYNKIKFQGYKATKDFVDNMEKMIQQEVDL